MLEAQRHVAFRRVYICHLAYPEKWIVRTFALLSNYLASFTMKYRTLRLPYCAALSPYQVRNTIYVA